MSSHNVLHLKLLQSFFYIPPHDSGGVLWFQRWMFVCLCVGLSIPLSVVCPSVFRFQMVTWVNVNEFSPNLVCGLIFWRSGLGLLMGKFHQVLTELSAQDMPIFLFPDNNFLSKCHGILTKLGTCIDIEETGLGLLMGKFCQFLTVICPPQNNGGVLSFYIFIWGNKITWPLKHHSEL